MNKITHRPRVPLALAYVALPLLFAFSGVAENLLTGSTKWDLVLWREGLYVTAWLTLLPPIFRLCRWLHRGPSNWLRWTLGLGAGTVFTVILYPFLYQVLRIGLWAVAWEFSWAKEAPPAYWHDYQQLLPRLLTASVVIFASTVVAWYAVANYREAKERQLESVELGAMLQQAQLQALRSQLNPHFLFNTLHSIAELIHENPRHAEQMLLLLGDLLHKSLKTQAVEIPLGEELDFIRAYLAIEQMRLGDRLELVWKIEPAVLHGRVPSLILQPIVENAIQHGIAPSARGGRLEISAARAGDQLRLEVRDDGPGLAAHDGKGAVGIGIGHTRARLERLYGPRSSFNLANDRGLVVSMTLPWVDQQLKGEG